MLKTEYDELYGLVLAEGDVPDNFFPHLAWTVCREAEGNIPYLLECKATTLRFIEFITPGEFQYYFAEMAPYLRHGRPPQIDKIRETAAKYGLIVDPYAADEIVKQYGLKPLS
jgi:hypothetical protein